MKFSVKGLCFSPSLKQETPEMPLTPEETAILRSLSEPVDQRRRGDFIAEATRRLEAAPDHGPGVAHQVGRVVQRDFRDPPDLRKGRVGPRG